VQVEWGAELPRELRTVLEPFIMRYLDLLPSWCHTLQVVPEVDPTAYMSMTADYKYRRSKLFVGPEYLSRGDEEREQTVVHEFVHVINAPLIDFTDQLVELLKERDPSLVKMLGILQEAGMEAATEDCAMLLWRLTADRR
jgi:hypothetical protein